jgi:hypothetical protein
MFIQAKDEQSSLRFIASIGLMALSCISPQATAMTPIDTKSAMQVLAKKLRDGGIPYQLAGRLADEFIDISCLNQLYESIAETEGRDLVLLPLVVDLCEELSFPGTARSWSRAIHRAWMSKASADVTERFQSISHLVEDQALLLSKLHEGFSNEEALDDLFGGGDNKSHASLVRRVTIKLPADCVDLFPSPAGDHSDGFFRLESIDHQVDGRALPCISMQTRAGGFASTPLHVFLLDGKRFVNIVQRKLTFSNDCITAARSSAKEINIGCRAAVNNDNNVGRRIVLVQALGNAVDQAAKQADFRFETRMVVELTMAELMVRHRVVVLQALRIKDDQEMMLRQLALACFRFQLLTIKIP